VKEYGVPGEERERKDFLAVSLVFLFYYVRKKNENVVVWLSHGGGMMEWKRCCFVFVGPVYATCRVVL
jgi:hypothetical protein